MTRVIGIISGKGGVGKTTLVANLGSVLAQKFKKEVIIVDANVSTSHLGLYLGMYYTPVTLNQVLLGEAEIDDAIYDYHISGMRVIPASLSLSDMKGVDIARLKSSLKKLFGKADIVLLDAAPGLGREAIATVRASDEVIFVNTPFVPSTMDIIKCHQVANEIGVKPLGVVLNMVGKEKYELTPKEVEELIELLQELDRKKREITVKSGLEILQVCSNWSDDIHTPVFRKYFVPWFQEICQFLHAHGCLATTHLDGEMRRLNPLFHETGIDIAEAITPAPQTQVTMREFREQLGDEVTIWGGIPSILFEPMYSDEEFDAYVKNLFQEMAPGYRFIVGMGDNVPFDGDINRVRRVVELIDQYGKLPIEV